MPIVLSADPFTGVATASYSFDVPPGRSGLEPDLRISYNSDSTTPSYLGQGWSLTTPAVRRSTKDGQPKFDWTDTFVLIWQGRALDLKLFSDPGTGVREYYTVIETFMRIKSYSIPPALTYWEVEDGKGRKYQFGADGGSGTWTQVGDFEWALNRIEDQFGNYLTVDWLIDTGILYPKQIRYTGNTLTGLVPTNMVEFSYEGRNDITDSRMGVKSSLPKSEMRYRLRRLRTFVQSQPVALYLFDYHTASSFTYPTPLCSGVSCPANTTTCSDGSTASCLNSCQPDSGICSNCTPACSLCIGVTCPIATVTCGDGTTRSCTYTCNPSTGICSQCDPSSQCPLPGGTGGGNHHKGASIARQPPSLSGDSCQMAAVSAAGSGVVSSAALSLFDQATPSLLGSITRYNGTGQQNLPPQTFTYLLDETPQKSWGPPISDVPDAFLREDQQVQNGNAGEPYNIGDLGMQIADVNRDGLPDLIKALGFSDGAASQRAVYLNVHGTWTYNATWSATVPDDFIVHVGGTDNNIDSGLRLVDINSDGLTDLVRSWEPCQGCAGVHTVYENTGAGWVDRTALYSGAMPGFVGFWGGQSQDLGVRFGDVNGDGKIDLVKDRGYSGCAADEKGVFLNNGAGWGGAESNWDVPEVFTFHFCGGNTVDVGARLLDLNGDGLADIIKSVVTNGTPRQAVYLNRGRPDSNGVAWELAPDWDQPPEAFTIFTSSNQDIDDNGVRFADVNGDGRIDIVVANNYQDSHGRDNPYKKVYLHRAGKGWIEDPDFSANVPYVFVKHWYGAEDHDEGVRLADLDGDGAVDFVKGILVNTTYTTQRNMSLDSFTNIMSASTNGIGGSTSLTYTSSAAFNDPVTVTGYLGFVLPVLTQVTSSDGQSGTGHAFTSTYSYRGGLYQYQRREFRGFRYVRTDAPGGKAYSEQLFVQDPTLVIAPLTGSVEKQALRRTIDGAVLSADVNTFDRSDGLPPLFHSVSRSDSYLYDWATTSPIETLGATSAHKNVAVSYSYTFNGDGQVAAREIHSWGDTSTAADDLYVTTRFINDSTLWRIGYVYQRSVNDAPAEGGTLLARAWVYYDNKNLGTISAQANIAKSVQWAGMLPVDPLGSGNRVATYGYGDNYGHVTSVTDGASDVIYFDYGITDPTFTFLDRQREVTTGGGVQVDHHAEYFYDPRFGSVTAETQTGGSVSRTDFDDYGRPIRSWSTLDSQSLPTSCHQYNLTSSPVVISTFVRETSGVGEACGSSGMLSSVSFIDGLGREVERKTESSDPTNPSVALKAVTYNSQGLVDTVAQPFLTSGSVQTFSAPPSGALIVAAGYDDAGRQTSLTMPSTPAATTSYLGWTRVDIDPEGKRTEIDTDSGGHVVQSRTYTLTGQLYTTNSLQYDRLGLLRFIIDTSNNRIEYRYNSLGQKLLSIDPDAGQIAWQYNSTGTVRQVTDAQNRTTTFAYDEAGRVLLATRNDASTVTYRYDESLGGPAATGHLTSVEDSSTGVREELGYDALGRPTSIRKTIDGVPYTIYQTLDTVGRTTSLTYPDATSVAYQYGADGHISAIPGFALDFTYKPNGSLSHLRYTNGVILDNVFDPATNRLSNVNASGPTGQPLINTGYSYTASGHLSGIQDLIGTSTQTFGLDHLYRLTTATSPASYGALTYSYDALGNMTAKDKTATTGIDFNYLDPSHPHRASTTSTGLTLQYDASGAVTSALNSLGKGRTYNYNLDGRLSHLLDSQAGTEGWYTYDPQGKRVKRVDSQAGTLTTTLFLGDLYEKTGGSFKKYIYAGGRRLAEWRDDGTKQFYLTDTARSMNVITDGSGNLMTRIEYKPYGETSSITGSNASFGFMYAGARTDQLSGLSDFGARFYDPSLGRFLTPDPILSRPLDPRDLNPYGYALGNPLTYVDVGGYSSWPAIAGLVVGIGVTAATQGCVPCGSAAGGAVSGFLSARENGGDELNATLVGATIGGVSGVAAAGTGVVAQNTILAGAAGGAAGAIASAAFYGGDAKSVLMGAAEGAATAALFRLIPRHPWHDHDPTVNMDSPTHTKPAPWWYKVAVALEKPEVQLAVSNTITAVTIVSAVVLIATVIAPEIMLPALGLQALLAPPTLEAATVASTLIYEGAGAGGIVVSAEALNHVVETHTLGGSLNLEKSIFAEGEDLLELVTQAEGVAPRLQEYSGNLVRTVDIGRVVGYDVRSGMLPTSVYTVITDTYNYLITMFPGNPGRVPP